jgi:hypothetical protein
MTWFLVVIFQTILILVSLAIVASSYELPKVLYPSNTTNPPLDNPTDSDHNRTIEIDGEDYE